MSRKKSGYKPIFAKLNNLPIAGIGKLVVVKYSDGDRVAIQAKSLDNEPYGTLTVNIPECPLDENKGEILVKTWSENERFSKTVFDTGLFEDTGKRFGTGFVEAQVWRVKP
jgi:hypothetical protein